MVFVSGPPDKIDLARKALDQLDVAKAGQPEVVTGPPTVETYRVPEGNADNVAKALKELYQGRNVTISPVGNDAIIISALPDDQEAIRKYIQGSKDKTELQIIPLYTLEAKTVYKNLQTLFDTASGPAPMLEYDGPSNKIMVRGTPGQVAAVKAALKELGEKPAGGASSGAGLAAPVDKDNRMKQLEDKLDTLLKEMEILRRQSRTEPRRENRPR
jgi:type II secretory pathway component GspD/PulD (secretin)